MKISQFFETDLPALLEAWGKRVKVPNSHGSVVFSVVGAQGGSWSYRVSDEKLQVEQARASDAIVELGISDTDFEAVLTYAGQLFSEQSGGSGLAERVLLLDQERTRLISALSSTLLFTVADEARSLRVYLAGGAGRIQWQNPDCEISCKLVDLAAVLRGEKNPFELLMSGDLRIAGNAEVALSYSGLFA